MTGVLGVFGGAWGGFGGIIIPHNKTKRKSLAGISKGIIQVTLKQNQTFSIVIVILL